MLTLVMLKTASDLAFYYCVAGPLAVHYGASALSAAAMLCLMCLSMGASYLLRNKSLLRFAPMLIICSVPAIPGANTALYLLSVPAAAYVIYLGARRLYLPDRYRQTKVFSLLWKMLILILAGELIFGASQEGINLTVVMGLTALICSVLLMRSLRHDAEVYSSPGYQLLNLLAVAAVPAAAAVMSLETVLNGFFTVIKTIYRIIMGLILNVVMWIIRLIAAAFGKLGVSIQPEGQVPELDLSGAKEMFGLSDSGSGAGDAVKYVFIALGVIIAAGLLFVLFRYFSSGMDSASDNTEELLQSVRISRDTKKGEPEGTPVHRVRQQYKRFLKFCVKQGIEISESDTSGEISSRSSWLPPAEASAELREIYIKARYNGTASKEDAARARKLCTALRRGGSNE